jgi:hypothetical protein
MRITILGWGSLVWDPRDLPREDQWQEGGPSLPIEFSRVSSDARLTLVLDSDNGINMPTRFVLSPRTDIDDAIYDLRRREGTVSQQIGFVDLKHEAQRARIPSVAAAVRNWAGVHGFDGVVWTDLPPNFEKEITVAFSIQSAERYLCSLPKNVAEQARKYIVNAPPEVETPLRRRLRDIGWLGQ